MFSERRQLQNFLGGTFHQDINSPEEALEEYVKLVNKEWIMKIINCVNDFLDSDLSEEEKNYFIKSNAEIYFPAMGMTPVKWLEGVAEGLEKWIQGNGLTTLEKGTF